MHDISLISEESEEFKWIKIPRSHTSSSDFGWEMMDGWFSAHEAVTIFQSTKWGDFRQHVAAWQAAANGAGLSLITAGDWSSIQLKRAVKKINSLPHPQSSLVFLSSFRHSVPNAAIRQKQIGNSLALFELAEEYGGIIPGAKATWGYSIDTECCEAVAYLLGPLAARSLLDQAMPWRADLAPLQYAVLRLMGIEMYRWMPTGSVLALTGEHALPVAATRSCESTDNAPTRLAASAASAGQQEVPLVHVAQTPGMHSRYLLALRDDLAYHARQLAGRGHAGLWHLRVVATSLEGGRLALERAATAASRLPLGGSFPSTSISAWLDNVPAPIGMHAVCLAVVWARGGLCLSGGSRPVDLAASAFAQLSDPSPSRPGRTSPGCEAGEWSLAVGAERSAGAVVPWFAAGARGSEDALLALRVLLGVNDTRGIDEMAARVLARQEAQVVAGGLPAYGGQDGAWPPPLRRSAWLGLPPSADPRGMLALRDVYDRVSDVTQALLPPGGHGEKERKERRPVGAEVEMARRGVWTLPPTATDPLPRFPRPKLAALHRVATKLAEDPAAGAEIGCELRLEVSDRLEAFYRQPKRASPLASEGGGSSSEYLAPGAVVAPPPAWMGLRVPAVPRILHFVWVGGGAMPWPQAQTMRRWMQLHPAFEVMLWTDQDLPGGAPDGVQRPLGSLGAGTEVATGTVAGPPLSAFPALGRQIRAATAPEQRADLVRLEAVLRHGGFYVDLDFEPCRPIDVLARLAGAVVCHEDGDEGMWQSVSNGFFGFSRGHPVLQRAVSIAARAQVGHESPNWSTGPRLLRRALGEDGLAAAAVLPRETLYPVRFKDGAELQALGCAHHGEGGGCCQHYKQAFAVHWWSRTPTGDRVSPKCSRAPVLLGTLCEEAVAHSSTARLQYPGESAPAELLHRTVGTRGASRTVREVGGGACTQELLSTSDVAQQ